MASSPKLCKLDQIPTYVLKFCIDNIHDHHKIYLKINCPDITEKRRCSSSSEQVGNIPRGAKKLTSCLEPFIYL